MKTNEKSLPSHLALLAVSKESPVLHTLCGKLIAVVFRGQLVNHRRLLQLHWRRRRRQHVHRRHLGHLGGIVGVVWPLRRVRRRHGAVGHVVSLVGRRLIFAQVDGLLLVGGGSSGGSLLTASSVEEEEEGKTGNGNDSEADADTDAGLCSVGQARGLLAGGVAGGFVVDRVDGDDGGIAPVAAGSAVCLDEAAAGDVVDPGLAGLEVERRGHGGVWLIGLGPGLAGLVGEQLPRKVDVGGLVQQPVGSDVEDAAGKSAVDGHAHAAGGAVPGRQGEVGLDTGVDCDLGGVCFVGGGVFEGIRESSCVESQLSRDNEDEV